MDAAKAPGERELAEQQRRARLCELRYFPVVVCCLASASACSEPGVETIHDPCSPLMIVPGAGTQPEERQSIEDAILAWGDILPVQMEVGNPTEDAPWLPIFFQSNASSYRAMYMDASAEIWISRKTLDPADQPLAIAHELGHAFGLLHISESERPSIMNIGNLDIRPNADDGLAVLDLWESCSSDAASAED